MKKHLLTKMLLVAAMLGLGTSAWAADWTTVWTADFTSAPSGMTYSVANGSTDITNGYLSYHQGGGSGNRALTTAFTDSKFAVDTNWKLEFDWNGSSANTNPSNVVFATDQGTAFTITWASYATTAVITDASSTELTSELPILGYNKGTASSFAHIIITGDTENGIYLTVTNGATTYVDNVLVTSTFGYPATFSGSLGRAVSHMYIDNIDFATPKVAGFVAAPSETITVPDGTARKFTLSCMTDGATIYYAESDLEIGAAGWSTYTSEVTTSAETIYAYASDGVNNSVKISFATGAGTAVGLIDATVIHSGSGVYTIASDQSAILGAPTATIHYQIDGGAESTKVGTSVDVNILADGTLTYWLTADGYTSTDKANETVYAAITYPRITTIDFCTSNSNDWAFQGEEVTVSGDPDHTYYQYLDQSKNIVADGLLATTFINSESTWRIQRYYGGTMTYNTTEYIAVKGLTAGDIVQVKCSAAPAIVSNLTEVPAATYTGTYTYSAVADGDVILSFAKNNVITKIDLLSSSVSATIGTTGYTSFASSYPLNISGMTTSEETIEAYYVEESGVKNSYISFTASPDNVAAGTGLILKGDAGATVTIPVAASGTDLSATNKLVGCPTATTITDETANYENIYVLGASVAAFQNIKSWIEEGNSLEIPAGKAYLDATGVSTAPTLTFNFGGESTGISEMRNAQSTMFNEVYNLNGQRVAQPTKGLYITNGRKVVVK